MSRSGDHGILNEEVQLERVRLQDAIQRMIEALGRGIDFVEDGAPRIVEHMTEEGFHISIRVDTETGFVLGGNVCGSAPV